MVDIFADSSIDICDCSLNLCLLCLHHGHHAESQLRLRKSRTYPGDTLKSSQPEIRTETDPIEGTHIYGHRRGHLYIYINTYLSIYAFIHIYPILSYPIYHTYIYAIIFGEVGQWNTQEESPLSIYLWSSIPMISPFSQKKYVWYPIIGSPFCTSSNPNDQRCESLNLRQKKRRCECCLSHLSPKFLVW